MKRRRMISILLLTLTTGSMAGIAALRLLRSQATPLLAAETPKGRVAVAAKDLPLGTLLKPEHVRLIEWPSGALPAGYAVTADEVIGRGLITSVMANEPLLKTRLSTKDAGGGLSIVIPSGMRGVSVKVDEVISVAGFVLPGTYVDVLVTVQPPAPSVEQRVAVTKVILQNVRVLAAGQTTQRDADGKPQTVTVITLLVTPDDAERLTLAANEGRIHLALRNTLDLDSVPTRGARVPSLVGNVEGPTVTRTVRVQSPRGGPSQAGEAPGAAVVEMFKGGERTLQTFSRKRP